MIRANENTQIAKLENQAEEISSVSFPRRDLEIESGSDVLVEFRANLAQVEDLTARLKFVLGEVQHVIQKRR